MKRIITFGVLIVVLAIIGYRIATHGEEAAIKTIEDIQAEAGIPVVVEKVTRTTLEVTRNFTGSIQGAAQADAMANTTEDLIALFVKPGERVQKGQVVAELDADIASNMSLKYSQTKMAYEDARRNYERMQSLLEAGAVSQQMFEKAKLNYEIAERNYRAATKLIKIQAPISGTVTHIFYKVGETVRNGTPVVRIARLDEVLIELLIAETDIAGIANGQKAVVAVSAYPEKEFEGTLEQLSLSADPRTRSFTAWVRVENEGQLLRPGMFAKVRLLVDSRENALTISKDAVQQVDHKFFVYVVAQGQIAEERRIVPGASSGNLVEVIQGVQDGEQVVVLGQNKLTDGKKVKIVEGMATN